ncbi:hypothetical protein ABN034_07685 [Actinopolymorpha sp. B11F2]|uniref:hypothetical protein n=1 Tax=Actinopolymorpha sp. B11F2 TaxID=3160862 RepID=UPI0032E3B3B4
MQERADASRPYRFDFFEVVQIVVPTIAPPAEPTEGVVLGRAQNEVDDSRTYSVLMLDGMTTAFDETALRSIGRYVAREDIYTGASIRVSPQGDLLPPADDPRGADDES